MIPRWPLGTPRVPSAPAGVLLAVGSAQGADALTFVRMVRDHGVESEANPFVAYLAAAGDVLALVALKVALVVLIVALFVVLVRHHRFVAAGVATFGAVAGLVGAWSNVAVIAGPAATLLR